MNMIYTQQQLQEFDSESVPNHIAIIPDGNRRWAEILRQTVEAGHRRGADKFTEVVEAAKELGVKVVTFYTFSTENWSRPKNEVDILMTLIGWYAMAERESMIRNGVRLHTIGDLTILPKTVVDALEETKRATASCEGVDMVLAVNYGARDEICRAVQTMLDDYEKDRLKKEDVTEGTLARYLDTRRWKDPELLIRTSGEMRVSNFLLWQISYAEIYVEEVMWPDFTPQHLLDALIEYQKRKRRLGG